MIRLNKVSKTYRTDKVETLALKDIDLQVARGEFVAMMGPSGCGKSTLLNLIGLLDRLRAIGVKPSPEARDEARAVAADWKRGKRIGPEAMFKQETFAFLLLVGVFGLVEDVGGAGEVLDLIVLIASRERAVDAFVGLGLDLDQHMPGKYIYFVYDNFFLVSLCSMDYGMLVLELVAY